MKWWWPCSIDGGDSSAEVRSKIVLLRFVAVMSFYFISECYSSNKFSWRDPWFHSLTEKFIKAVLKLKKFFFYLFIEYSTKNASLARHTTAALPKRTWKFFHMSDFFWQLEKHTFTFTVYILQSNRYVDQYTMQNCHAPQQTAQKLNEEFCTEFSRRNDFSILHWSPHLISNSLVEHWFCLWCLRFFSM